jgi:hypothetical protein
LQIPFAMPQSRDDREKNKKTPDAQAPPFINYPWRDEKLRKVNFSL